MPTTAGGYRVQELARLTGLSVRNIREYQDRGLLSPPQRVGRVALYGPEHAVRLQLIARLLGRGYTIAVIRDLLQAWATGRDLADVLGFEAVVSRPWTDEEGAVVTLVDLRRMFGPEITAPVLRKALALGILRAAGGRSFVAPSPALLTAGQALAGAGIPLDTVLDVIQRVRDQLELPAQLLVGMVFDELLPDGAGLPQGPALRALNDTIAELRPHAVKAVEALFAGSMTRAVDVRFAAITEQTVGHEPAQRRSSARQSRSRTATTAIDPPENQ